MKYSFKHIGDFSKTLKFLNAVTNKRYLNRLNDYGQIGVDALYQATPKNTGLTAASWDYVIESQNGRTTISWFNKNVVKGINIAIILDHGHGTGRGTYVQGRHYISPAIRPVFDKIADDIWKEVKGL